MPSTSYIRREVRASVVVSNTPLIINGATNWTGADPLVNQDRIYSVCNNGDTNDLLVMIQQADDPAPVLATIVSDFDHRIPVIGTRREEIFVKAGEVAYIVRAVTSTAKASLRGFTL